MLEILQNNMYTVTPKANPGMKRESTALAAVTGGVLSIGGKLNPNGRILDLTWLSTVSKYDITNDTW